MENSKPISPDQMNYLVKLGYPTDAEYVVKKSNSFKNPGKEYVAMNGNFCFFLDRPQKYTPKKTENPFSSEGQPESKKIKIDVIEQMELFISKLDTIEQMLHELLTK
jgi:hypothetical protein